MPTTCTKSTAASTATTCSSTSGPSRRGRRGRIRRSMTWSLRLRARTGHRLRPALVPALGGDPVAARRRPDRGRLHAAGSLLGGVTSSRLRPPDGRGRPGGAGEGRLAHREGSVVVTGGWIPAGQGAQSRRPGLLASLAGAVRPEFRADELAFDPGDPVFGGKPCLVPGLRAHGLRSRALPGAPAAVGGSGPARRRGIRRIGRSPVAGKGAPLARCRAPGCRYGVTRRKGLCARHARAWERAGAPDLQEWLGTMPGTAPADPAADCRIGGCQLWAEPGAVLCRRTARPGTSTGGRRLAVRRRPGRATPFSAVSGSGWTACPRT